MDGVKALKTCLIAKNAYDRVVLVWSAGMDRHGGRLVHNDNSRHVHERVVMDSVATDRWLSTQGEMRDEISVADLVRWGNLLPVNCDQALYPEFNVYV